MMKNLLKKWDFLVALLVLLGTLLLFHLSALNPTLNRLWFDTMSRKFANPAELPESARMVMIDESALAAISSRYRERWPWPRDMFGALVAALYVEGATTIALDLLFLEQTDAARDDLLVSYCAATGAILALPSHQTPFPFQSKLAPGYTASKYGGLVDFKPDSDSVTRTYLDGNSLAQRATKQELPKRKILRWYGGLNEIIQLRPELVQSAKSYVLQGMAIMEEVRKKGVDEYDPEAVRMELDTLRATSSGSMKGQVVFVGVNAAAGFDVKATPVNAVEAGTLIHYTAWVNANENHFFHSLNPTIELVGAVVLGALVLLAGWLLHRVWISVLLVLILFGAVMALSALMFQESWLVPPGPFAVSIFCAFLCSATRNWYEEFRKRSHVKKLFGSYVSDKVVKRLLESGGKIELGGEKRDCTAYFSDLAGFTNLSETLSPEELISLVNRYLSEMSDFIIDQGGYLDKYIGDAIMGVFGAPEPQEDHAMAACRAALQSRERLVILNEMLALPPEKQLAARIGINTGPMVVGNVGCARKMNYTVLGDAVNLASRLEGANKEFGTTILIGDGTKNAIGDKLVTRPIEYLRVKGKKEPVMVHELVSWTLDDNPDLRAFMEAYLEGFLCYRHQRFKQAVDAFTAAHQLRPHDKMAEVYRNRAITFEQHPPPPDWDGVFVMTSK